jgi:hypothetical protein
MSRERASLQVLPPLGGGGVGAMMDYGFMSQLLRYCTLVLYFEFSLVYLHKTVRIKTRGVGNGGL